VKPSPCPRLVVLLAAATSFGACSHSSPDRRDEPAEATARVGYGTVMAEVARRFELLGRAASAGRFELADYQLGEIVEQFEETLPHAAPPREGHPEVLPELANAFLESKIPVLRRALDSRDRAQAAAAFKRVATACNGCHQASGHGFIEVPVVTGRSIPSTGPASP
jgi:hypothetical protein